MTNITQNKPRRYRGDLKIITRPSQSSATPIPIGAAVQENAGAIENLTGAGTTFEGFLREASIGNGTAVDDTVRVELAAKGEVELLVDAIGAGTISRADVGATVYATDNDTFTLDSTGAQAIGKVSEVPEGAHGAAAANVWVQFEGQSQRSL